MKNNKIQIIGHQGCGKTTLISKLIKTLTEKGVKVGALKHSAHSHELDKPGKDSFCMRQAGAAPVAMMTKDMTAIYMTGNNNLSPDDLISRYFFDSDIILIEGWISGPYEKIEVFGNSCKKKPLFHEVSNVIGFVSDCPLNRDDHAAASAKNISVFSRLDIRGIVNFIYNHL